MGFDADELLAMQLSSEDAMNWSNAGAGASHPGHAANIHFDFKDGTLMQGSVLPNRAPDRYPMQILMMTLTMMTSNNLGHRGVI